MNTLVRGVMLVVITLLSLFGLDRLYTFGLLHNQNLKITSVAAQPRNATLLIHGPCEPLWIVSPGIIDKHTGFPSYNLALSHSDFADNYLHLYLYLKHNKAPKYLLLFVTPESFDKRFNTFNSYRFAPYLDDSLVNSVVRENDPEYFRWTFIPFMRYAYYGKRVTFPVVQGLKHYFEGRTGAHYPDGFEPPARRVWGNHQGQFVKLYEENILFRKDSLRVKYFLQTIELAKERGIRVILYESPVLRESLPWQPNRDEFIAMIRRAAGRLDVEYIQFSELDMARHRKYFNSTLTLNMEGVKLFNDTLGRYLRVLCEGP